MPRELRARAARIVSQMAPVEAAALGMLVVITLLALAAPVLAPADPVLKIGAPYQPPSLQYVFGTDEIGRDMLARMLYGLRLTWLPSLLVIATGVVAGTAIGVLGALAGGIVDLALARLTDLFIVIPSTMIALAIVAALGPGIWHTVIAMSIFWWTWYARVVRTELKTTASRPHAEAARLSGVRARGW